MKERPLFTDDEPLPPEKRIFLQSTAALLIEGVRSITNGLVLRRSLGDLKREIELARGSRFTIESLPLTEQERSIASALTEPASIESFLKRFAAQSVTAAKVVIAMLALGVYSPSVQRASRRIADGDSPTCSATWSCWRPSARATSARCAPWPSRGRLPALDHYQVLDVPRAATRAQIMTAAEALRQKYDPTTFPPIVRDAVKAHPAPHRRSGGDAEGLRPARHRTTSCSTRDREKARSRSSSG